jgi:hypothetical protein
MNTMARKCFISFKAEDELYKLAIQGLEDLDVIDKSLNEPINSSDFDYIMQKIRSDYLSDSTVTIHLIGLHGAENRGSYEQRYIKAELQASLYDSSTNTKNGILGIVLPNAIPLVFKGRLACLLCGNKHNHVSINDSTTIREFSHNYYIPNNKCYHAEDDRYCVLTTWGDFLEAPNLYVEAAFSKRGHPIADKTKVRP